MKDTEPCNCNGELHPQPSNTNKENNMKTYAPSTELYYVIESDGDAWFAHYSDFTNLQESDEVAFGKTPQEALQKFLDSRVKANE